MAAPGNNIRNRILEICVELGNVRLHLSEIDRQMQDVRLGGTIEELFYLISRYSTYLQREFELEYELRTDYNFVYPRYH
ncbi:hypothetical protein H5410_054150 [Solanum commersonii]|uniref:Uncharacterized protein n=1 Tax=Solanum commersonii TaxID=4109 RepID=A0A9J5X5T8_SOLCO|nr:hypothetical protein H5410_054150 [Solanum commersonii]